MNAYHHGDLKSQLITQGIKLLSSGGAPGETDAGGQPGQTPTTLSLRGLARDLGVSATAVYHHFPSKEALLEEISISLFTELLQDWEGMSLREIGASYLEFFLKRPGLLNLLFSTELGNSQQVQALQLQAFEKLKNKLSLALLPNSKNTNDQEPNNLDPDTQAMLLWATVHGLSSLACSGSIGLPQGSCPGAPEVFEQDPRILWQRLSSLLL